jgi:hypothetical protein
MRHLTSTEPRFVAHDSTPCAEHVATPAQAQSALHMTRAAIARWSGGVRPSGTLTRDLAHVSAQARWLADAQFGLAAWIAHGGFTQADDSCCAARPPTQDKHACID